MKSAGLWFSLVFPSLFITQKLLGWIGMGCYIVIAAIAVTIWQRSSHSFPSSSRAIAWWTAATLIAVTTAFLLIYPRVNSRLPGQGSDDDDANNVGAIALVTGHSPYEQRTYLGNVLHQLPGAFVLALPFVLIGTSAIQNLFWLPMFFGAVRAETGNARMALHLAWLVLAVSPTVIHQVITGTAHLANTLYVLLGLWWLLRTPRTKVAAVAWGVALASRANFLLLVPLAFGWLRQHRGLDVAIRAMSLTSATVALLSIPFYLYDVHNFGPLEAADRLLRFDSLVPYSGETILLMTAAVSVGLSVLPMNDMATMFRNCAIVQAVVPAVGTVLGTLQRRAPDLSYATYGTFFAWFAFMSFASALYQYGHRTSVSD